MQTNQSNPTNPDSTVNPYDPPPSAPPAPDLMAALLALQYSLNAGDNDSANQAGIILAARQFGKGYEAAVNVLIPSHPDQDKAGQLAAVRLLIAEITRCRFAIDRLTCPPNMIMLPLFDEDDSDLLVAALAITRDQLRAIKPDDAKAAQCQTMIDRIACLPVVPA